MKEGADPSVGDEVPVDGNDATSYSPSNAWGDAGGIGAGGAKVVFLGSVNSVNVTGLATDTTYYVRIYEYAGNGTGDTGINYLEETPLSGSSQTITVVSQATNLWINNIGQTTMSLRWSKGIGDGSIVVMKQGGPVDSDPVDGTEHVANSTFGVPGEELTDPNPGNWVVYRGSGEFVNVIGLTEDTIYHAAVYNYTGSGASIDYEQLNPARAIETTSVHTPHNVLVMTQDPSVTCSSGCHGAHGGALVPRGTEQEFLCRTCHQPTIEGGMAGAADKTSFALHTNDKSPDSPPASPGVVDCGSCHELHNPSGDDTVFSQHPISGETHPNLYQLRANPDKYVPSALTSDLVLHDDTLSADRAFEDGAAYQGACQICHTNTPTGYQNTSAGDDIHKGGGAGNVNCKGCHTHDGGFAGAGGDCTGCHNAEQDKDSGDGNRPRRNVMWEFPGAGADPDLISTHLTPTVDAADCEVCHNHTPDSGSPHQEGQVNFYNVDTGDPITLTSYANPSTENVAADRAALTTFCLTCHDENGANGDTTPFTTGATAVNIKTGDPDRNPGHDWTNASHNTSGAISCFGDGAFGCHGSGHGGEKLTLLAPSTSGPGTNNSDEREQFCFNCHDGSPASTNIVADFSGDLHTATSASLAVVSNRHDVMPVEQTTGGVVTCNNCHGPHINNNANPVADPDDGSPLGDYDYLGSYTDHAYNFNYYSTTSDHDPSNPLGGGSVTEPDYIRFCLACHDGTTPPGVTMTPNMINMADAYAGLGGHTADKHGTNPGPDHGGQAGKGGLKTPWTDPTDLTCRGNYCDEQGPYAALNCSSCHGSHGTGSIYNLKSEITVAGTVMSVGGDGCMDDPSYAGDTSYTLPLMDGNVINDSTGVQTDHYWGAWCTFCHKMDSHCKAEDDACTGNHMHGKGSF